MIVEVDLAAVVVGPPEHRDPALAPGDQPALPGVDVTAGGRKNSLSLNQVAPPSSLATIQPEWADLAQVEREVAAMMRPDGSSAGGPDSSSGGSPARTMGRGMLQLAPASFDVVIFGISVGSAKVSGSTIGCSGSGRRKT